MADSSEQQASSITSVSYGGPARTRALAPDPPPAQAHEVEVRPAELGFDAIAGGHAASTQLSQGGFPEAVIDAHTSRGLWWLVSVIVGLSAGAALATQALGGDPTLRRLFLAGLIATAGSGLWLGKLKHAAAPVSTLHVAAGWLGCCAGICTAMLYFGALSAVVVVVIFVIFFVGLAENLGIALGVYATLAVAQATFVVLDPAALDDRGVIASRLGSSQRAAMELLLQVVLFSALLVARTFRNVLVRTVAKLEQLARLTGHHEAMREDARSAIERSLRSAGGGRFTHQVLGSYRLGRLLGEGAMGEVYEAMHTTTRETAAVKVLRREALGSPEIVQRFLAEAQIIASLQADHIVRVLETAAPGSAAIPYIAMERLYGHDLRALLRACPDGRLPARQLCDVLGQVARGIDTAHRANIIHRDVKPSNLFFDEEQRIWKLLDFGVSKLAGEATDPHLVGTPHYMAPEQVRGDHIDRRVDVFALGVIAYRMITGVLPFKGTDTAAVLYQVVHHDPLPPSCVLAGLPPAIDEVILTALAKDRASRHASAGALAKAAAAALSAASTEGGGP